MPDAGARARDENQFQSSQEPALSFIEGYNRCAPFKKFNAFKSFEV